jgi:hypothetical protein
LGRTSDRPPHNQENPVAFLHPHCDSFHDLVADARRCESQDWFRCSWLIERSTEDGLIAVDCGAWAKADDRGWQCEAGHSHVYMDVRDTEGWDYADGDGEAKQLLGLGVDVVSMHGDGFVWGVKQ